jgi:hypothetical protein
MHLFYLVQRRPGIRKYFVFGAHIGKTSAFHFCLHPELNLSTCSTNVKVENVNDNFEKLKSHLKVPSVMDDL